MTDRATALKQKYGDDYFSKLSKKVKTRQGFHTRGVEFARNAQTKSVAKRKNDSQ